MRNYPKKRLEEYVDKPTYAIYDRLLMQGKSPEEAIEELNHASREHGRTPMQWNGKSNGGFSDAKPWFAVNPNYAQLNYEAQKEDPDSLLNFYKRMVAVRRRADLEETFIYGEFLPRYEKEDGILAYERRDEKNRLLILTSARKERVKLPFEERVGEILLDNYDTEGKDSAEAAESSLDERSGSRNTLMLEPFQCLVLKLA